jgi:hypothetical protein
MKAVSGKRNIQPSEIRTSFIQINVSWNVTLSCLVHTTDVFQQYAAIILMVGESVAHLYQTTLRHIPEDGS